VNRRHALYLMLPLAGAAVAAVDQLARRRPRSGPPQGGSHAGRFPNVVLRTHEGRLVHLQDLLRGRTVLAHFLDTTCEDPLCTAAAENLVRLGRSLGDRCGRDVFPCSFTLSPGRDSPARLRAWLEKHPLGPGWTLLTGSPWDLEACRTSFGLWDEAHWRHRGPAPHANLVVIGNEPHQRWTAASALTDPEVLLEKIDRVAGIKS